MFDEQYRRNSVRIYKVQIPRGVLPGDDRQRGGKNALARRQDGHNANGDPGSTTEHFEYTLSAMTRVGASMAESIKLRHA